MRVTYDGSIGSKSELVLPKTKTFPPEISVECYFSAASAEWQNGSNKVSVRASISVFGVISPKSTFTDLNRVIQEDVKRSMICRLAILEEQILDQTSGENVETLFSSCQIPKRVNYALGDLPVSLYERCVS